ncbi:BsuPI-related putative proteinase inhibitor [Halopiger xanaduensis]|uniref:Intracellular proteinase inhibitor BsuPI domain-containing protein n=1 Tax=Halopiger xanaduensis (strain DSM 18323 / JCM 14033 / SH-6) TaxID=797210 RepID=F8DBN9_HALXS|nr:BsuPI-related putative proteinase inhibitor [Halopiger xanaduensis]AEH38306.1 hypothetical protein Halxa_3699 [Halopiger xanaduensis SH-6]
MTLEGSLEARVSTDGDGTGSPAVAFRFTVTNTGAEPLELQFSDAAKAEFVVQDEDREVWRFTEGRAFMQMLSAERLAPEESTTYDGEWERPRPGEYTAVAELRAQEASCEARTEFIVPD